MEAVNTECVSNLTHLVSRAHVAIAAMHRLRVPQLFRSPSKSDFSVYGETLLRLDFGYFRTPEYIEDSIKNDDKLMECDANLGEMCAGVVGDICNDVFYAVQNYAEDLNKFLADLEQGGDSLSSLLQHAETQQLLCESLYLMGVQLMLLERFFEGAVREKLIVANYRYNGQNGENRNMSNIEDLCRLMRDNKGTDKKCDKGNGFSALFQRINLPNKFIRLVLATLRSDDVYQRLKCYGDPDHRSTALATQASMLFVCLFFSEQTLREETATMREIVDKFFHDNFVIDVYMGHLANVAEAWSDYKAASLAMANTINNDNMERVTQRYISSLLKSAKELQKFSTLSTSLLPWPTLMTVIQDSNVSLRWIFLHTLDHRLISTKSSLQSSKNWRRLRAKMLSKAEIPMIVDNLINLAQLEQFVYNEYSEQLSKKRERFESLKDLCTSNMSELANLVGNDQALLPRMIRSERLKVFCLDMREHMEKLDITQTKDTSRIIQRVTEALKQTLNLQEVEKSAHITQIMQDNIENLRLMMITLNLSENYLTNLRIISDFSAALQNLEFLKNEMQRLIQKDAHSIHRLRPVFVKVAETIGKMRVVNMENNERFVVHHVYSFNLVEVVKAVLQIVPSSIVSMLDEIIDLQTRLAVPNRVDREALRALALPEQRYEVAKLTHSMSVLTEGLLSMQSTKLGVISMEPQSLLEEGIRMEIERQVVKALNEAFVNKDKNLLGPESFFDRLSLLGQRMSGLMRSFEYVEHYLHIVGPTLLRQELNRILNNAIEKETKQFGRTLNSKNIMNIDNNASFMTHLLNELLILTDPNQVYYCPSKMVWLNHRRKSVEVSALRLLLGLESCMPNLLHTLDHLLALNTKKCIRELESNILKNVVKDPEWVQRLDNLADSLTPVQSVVHQPAKFYATFFSRSPVNALATKITAVGQRVLLRQLIVNRERLQTRRQAATLLKAVRALDKSVAKALQDKTKNRDEAMMELELLFELTNLSEKCGQIDVPNVIYLRPNCAKVPRMKELLFLLLVNALSKLTLSPQTNTLVPRRPDEFTDGHVFLLGFSCLLKQYRDSHLVSGIMNYLVQYIRSFYEAQSQSKKEMEFHTEIVVATTAFKQFERSGISANDERLAEPLLHLLKTMQ